jgi:tetratricopeptide (TPR) repeat protein
MIRLYIIIFFCLIINEVFPQQENIDRLQSKLLTLSHDTARVNTLNELATVHTNLDSAVIYAQQGINLAKKINFLKGEAACFLSMGNAYCEVLDEFKANEAFQESLKIYRKIQDKRGIWLAFGGDARIYYLEKDFKRELNVHFKLEKLSREFNSVDMLLVTFTNIGQTYQELGQLDSAEIYLRLGYELSHQSTSDNRIGSVLLALGSLLSAKGKNDEALYYLHKSLGRYLKGNDKVSIGETYSSLAEAYLNVNRQDSAFSYAKKSFDLAKEKFYASLERITITGNLLSLLYEHQKNYKEALHYLRIAKAAQDSAAVQERVSKAVSL